MKYGLSASDIAVILMGKHRPRVHTACRLRRFRRGRQCRKDWHDGQENGRPSLYLGTPATQDAELESYGDRQQRKPEDLIYAKPRLPQMLPKNKLAYQMIKKLEILRRPR